MVRIQGFDLDQIHGCREGPILDYRSSFLREGSGERPGLKGAVRWVRHDARENDSVPDARVCNHACGHGGFCDLRTSLGPILLGRSLLRRLGWLGLGWPLVGRLGRPLPLGAPLPAITPSRFFISVLWRAPQSSSTSRRLLEGAAAA